MKLTKHGKYLATVPALSWWLADHLKIGKHQKYKSQRNKKSSTKRANSVKYSKIPF